MKRNGRLRIASVAVSGLALVAAAAMWRAFADPPHFFAHGETPVVLYGDSISQEGAYVRDLEAFLYSRFPDWDLRILNLGINGDTAGLRRRGGQKRTAALEFPAFAPRAAMICFGMNDAREEGYAEEYPENLLRFVGKLQDHGARVLVLSPTAEEGEEPGHPAGSAYNHRLAVLRDAARSVASQTGARFIDLHRPFVAAVESGRNAGVLPETGEEGALAPDGVHPSAHGHLLMAVEILRALKVPGNVSSATVDAIERRITSGQGCSVEMIRDVPPGDIAFRRRDRCLPWAVSVDAARRLAAIPGYETFLDELSGWFLSVTGLKSDTLWQLEVNGDPIGMFGAQALADGVNLTLAAGAAVGGKDLMALLAQREALWVERYRKVMLFELPDWAEPDEAERTSFAPVASWLEQRRATEMARLDALIAPLEERIRQVCQPVTHVYRLRPLPRVLSPQPQDAAQAGVPLPDPDAEPPSGP